MSEGKSGFESVAATSRLRSVDVIYDRRAVRAYTPDTPSDTAIHALLDAAVHAPTAMHEEPWRFVVVQNRAILQQISDRAKAIVVAEAASHGNHLKPPGSAGDGIPSPLADPGFNIFYDAGTLIIICAVMEKPFVGADCWLAAENLMLAAVEQGLGTCPIGFAVDALNTPEVKSLLQIPAELTAVAPIILGVPRGEAHSVPRKAPVVVNWVRPTAIQDSV